MEKNIYKKFYRSINKCILNLKTPLQYGEEVIKKIVFFVRYNLYKGNKEILFLEKTNIEDDEIIALNFIEHSKFKEIQKLYITDFVDIKVNLNNEIIFDIEYNKLEKIGYFLNPFIFKYSINKYDIHYPNEEIEEVIGYEEFSDIMKALDLYKKLDDTTNIKIEYLKEFVTDVKENNVDF